MFSEPNKGSAAYRLKIVDRDGSITYSAVVNSNCESTKANIIKIQPNPSAGSVKIQVSLKNAGTYTLRIVDGVGRTILHQQQRLRSGDNILTSGIASLPNGRYTVCLNGNEVMETQELIILR